MEAIMERYIIVPPADSADIPLHMRMLTTVQAIIPESPEGQMFLGSVCGL